jgi:dephospho-CoA kinase
MALQKDNFKYAIALTGGIATGKSTTISLLTLNGFRVIDTDKIAHKLLDDNHQSIAKLFGNKYVQNNKVIRSELGKIIFSDKNNKKLLEDLLHPLIKQEVINQSIPYEKLKTPYMIDIPLFFETKNYDIEKSVVIYTPKELQLIRLQNRDNYNYDDALMRIENQFDIETKKKLATYIIDNSSDLSNLQKQVEIFKKDIL